MVRRAAGTARGVGGTGSARDAGGTGTTGRAPARAGSRDAPDPSRHAPDADPAGSVRAAEGPGAPPPCRNEVVLVGRVAAAAEERELPSGDVLAAFRLVVDRPSPRRSPAGRTVSVDTLDCTAWAAGLRRTARALGPGDVVEVQGALRRRFWRAGAGPASRTEVEVGALRRLARAAPTAAARAGRSGRREDADRGRLPAGQES